MTDKQFEQIECLTKKLWGDINNGHEYSMVTYSEFLGIVTEVWEELQEEPVSEDLEKAAKHYLYSNILYDDVYVGEPTEKDCIEMFKAGAKWQKEHLWKPADGDDLPEYEREVVVFTQNFPNDAGIMSVAIGHRPNPNGWDGKSLSTGKVEHYTPKTYGKGGWNIPDIVYWLDVKLPKEIEL